MGVAWAIEGCRLSTFMLVGVPGLANRAKVAVGKTGNFFSNEATIKVGEFGQLVM